MLQFLTRYKTRWINLLWNILQEYFILSNHWISAQPIMAWAHAEKKLRRIRRSWSKLWVAKPFIDVDAQIGRHKLYRPNKNFYTMKNCLISSHPVEGTLLPNLSTSSSLNFIRLHLMSGPGAGTDCDKRWMKNLVTNVTSLIVSLLFWNFIIKEVREYERSISKRIAIGSTNFINQSCHLLTNSLFC